MVLATETDSEIVESSAAPPSTETLNVKATGGAPAANVGVVAVTAPPELPTAGAVIVQPKADEDAANVVPAGTGAVSVTSWAASGPVLVTVIVKVRSPPAATGFGSAVTVTARSARAELPAGNVDGMGELRGTSRVGRRRGEELAARDAARRAEREARDTTRVGRHVRRAEERLSLSVIEELAGIRRREEFEAEGGVGRAVVRPRDGRGGGPAQGRRDGEGVADTLAIIAEDRVAQDGIAGV